MPDSTDALQKVESRLAELDQQVRELREEVSRLKGSNRPRLPWKLWVRHKVKQLLGLEVQLGRLSFPGPPRQLVIPRRYHRKPVLINPPVISIVTPSFNQGAYLEKTITSVLAQEYPRLEYVVQDGGSADSTASVLDRFRGQLHHCEMRKDNGQAHAINLGFAHTSGEVMAYLNSDDLLLPGALHAVAAYFTAHPEVDVVYSHRILIDSDGEELGRWVLPPHDDAALKWLDYVPQETLFWRRSIWDKVGGIDEQFRFAMDWDLILRFQAAGAKFHRLPRFLGAFRVHDSSKTMTILNSAGAAEAALLYRRSFGRDVTLPEVHRGMRRYYHKHTLYTRLYQLGLFRY